MEYIYSICKLLFPLKMIFNKYFETLLGSKVKIKILRNLFRFPTKIFTSRELACNIKVSHTGVLKSLSDLQGMNIIKIENHGNSNLITLNKESLLYNELDTLFKFESASLKYLNEEIKRIFPHAKTIALFGSIAKNTEALNSDIDVLIITGNKTRINEIIAKNQGQFIKLFGNMISPHIMTENEFKVKRNTNFIKGILENYILIKGNKL